MSRLGIIMAVLLAVTLPVWGIFAGGMLAAGDAWAAARFLALIAGAIAMPMLMVAAVARSLSWLAGAHRLGTSPVAAALTGAIVGTAIIMAFAQNIVVALLLGAIPGAGVALAVQPARLPEDGEDDRHP